MTLQEYDDDVRTWSELEEIAYNSNLSGVLENVYDRDSFTSIEEDYVSEFLENNTLSELKEYLENLPIDERYDRYVRDDYSGWIGSDDGDYQFNDYKDILRTDLINDNWFDEENDEEDTEEEVQEVQPEPLEPIETEDISFDEMFTDAIERSVEILTANPVEFVNNATLEEVMAAEIEEELKVESTYETCDDVEFARLIS